MQMKYLMLLSQLSLIRPQLQAERVDSLQCALSLDSLPVNEYTIISNCFEYLYFEE